MYRVTFWGEDDIIDRHMFSNYGYSDELCGFTYPDWVVKTIAIADLIITAYGNTAKEHGANYVCIWDLDNGKTTYIDL